MRARISHILLVCAALGGSNEAPRQDSKPAVAEPAVAEQPAIQAADQADLPLPVLPADQAARVSELAAKFSSANGSPTCDTEALVELRVLRESFDPAGPLREALLAAFSACDERVALAVLLAQTLPATPTAQQQLELGVAWIRASRYEDAAEVLTPVAVELGPDTKAAWLTGFALFHAGHPEQALPWLE